MCAVVGRCFCLLLCVSVVGLHFRPAVVLGWVWEATRILSEKGMVGDRRILRGGMCPIITSGLRLSWVMVPLGSRSL